jgi:hypothetical protein
MPALAFPTAEGFGRNAVGGVGGVCIHVTNLNDTGAGSLRFAIDYNGARTIVFDIDGTITIHSPLKIKHPFCSILGQTAPGEGITVRGDYSTAQSHDIVIMFMRFRPGDVGDWPETADLVDCFNFGQPSDVSGTPNTHDIYIFHCSMSWAIDESCTTWFGAYNITIHACLIYEALGHSQHSKTLLDGSIHSMGVLFGSGDPGFPSYAISLYECVVWSCNARNPQIAYCDQIDIRNCIFGNWGSRTGDGTTAGAPCEIEKAGLKRLNIVNCIWVPGPNSTSPAFFSWIVVSPDVDTTTDPGMVAWLSGNWGPYFGTFVTDPGFDQWLFMRTGGGAQVPEVHGAHTFRASSEFAFPHGPTRPTSEVPQILWSVGCSRPFRDAHDERVLAQILLGLGLIIDSQDDVGGYETMLSRPTRLDTDQDGMPDDWEDAHGLNKNSAADGITDRNGDGVENLLEFALDLAGPTAVITQPLVDDGLGNLVADTYLFAGYSYVRFHAYASICPFGQKIVDYEWTWGDGSPNTHGPIASHRYDAAGDKYPTLKVRTSSRAYHQVAIKKTFLAWSGTTLLVDTATGDDADNGLTEATAFKTVLHAFAVGSTITTKASPVRIALKRDQHYAYAGPGLLGDAGRFPVPSICGTYGSGAAPIIDVATGEWLFRGNDGHWSEPDVWGRFVHVEDWDVRWATANTDDNKSDYRFGATSHGTNLLRCKVTNGTFEGTDANEQTVMITWDACEATGAGGHPGGGGMGISSGFGRNLWMGILNANCHGNSAGRATNAYIHGDLLEIRGSTFDTENNGVIDALLLSGCQKFVLMHNTFRGGGNSCVSIGSNGSVDGSSEAQDAWFEANDCRNGHTGLNAQYLNRGVVKNNLIVDCTIGIYYGHSHQTHLDERTQGVDTIFNTIVGATNQAICTNGVRSLRFIGNGIHKSNSVPGGGGDSHLVQLGQGSQSTQDDYLYCTLVGNAYYDPLITTSTDYAFVFNDSHKTFVQWQAAGFDAGARPLALFGVDPLFVNFGTGDFHLQATSPWIDAGEDTPEVYRDITERARSDEDLELDIGAYEFFALDPALAKPPSAQLTITRSTPLVSITTRPPAGALTLTPQAPRVQKIAIPGRRLMALAGQRPVVVKVARPPSAPLVLTTFAPIASNSGQVVVAPPRAQLLLTPAAPVPGKVVLPPAAALTLTPKTPRVVISALPPSAPLLTNRSRPLVSKTVYPPAGALTITSFPPRIPPQGETTVSPPTAALFITSHAPSVIISSSVGDNVRRAIQQLLLGATAAGARVYTNRAEAWESTELPAIGIYTLEDHARIFTEAPREYQLDTRIAVECLSAEPRTMKGDDRLDQFSESVFILLATRNAETGAARFWYERTSYAWGEAGRGRTVMVARQEWIARTYLSVDEIPPNASDLRLIDGKWRFAGSTVLRAEDEVDLDAD